MAKRHASGLTRRVWQALIDARQPLTPAQVREALGDRWAYTTVTTVLSRLVAKGAASREPNGRAFTYRAVADEDELTARQMRRLLEGRENRAAVLARFVDVLSTEDEKVLGELLGGPGEKRRPR